MSPIITKTYRFTLAILTLLVILADPCLCQAEPHVGRTVVIKANQTTVNLGPYLEMLEDKTGKLKLGQVTSPGYDNQFRPMAAKTLNFGLTKSVFWFRFTYVLSQSPRTTDYKKHPQWLLCPGFVLPQRGQWQVYESQTTAMTSLKPVEDAGYELTGSPNHFKTVYFRVATRGPFAFEPQILSLHSYIKQQKLFLILTGSFFGIILGVAFYHLVIYFAMRKISYLWYVLHLIFLGIYFLYQNGFINEIFNGLQTIKSTKLNITFLAVALLFGALFTRDYLTGNNQNSIKRKFLNLIILSLSVMVILLPFLALRSGSVLLTIVGFISACIAIFFSLSAWQEGSKSAGFFLVAWLTFLLGGIAHILTFVGLVPYNSFIFNSFQIGAAISAVAFAVSLGSRLEHLKKQRDSFQQQEGRIRVILDSITSGVMLIDPRTNKITDINRHAVKILEANHKSIINANWKNYLDFLSDKPKDLPQSANDTLHSEGFVLNWQNEKIPVIVDANLIKLNNQEVILLNFKQISELKKVEQEREKLIQELKKALSDVKLLTGLLPICAGCKKIRDDKGYWNQIDDYFREHSDVDFSHSLCPECLQKLYPEMSDIIESKDKE